MSSFFPFLPYQFITHKLYWQIVKIIYEDQSILVVNKDAGEPALPDKSGDRSVIDQVDKTVEAVHRLDRPSSGLLLLARTENALKNLQKQLKSGEVEKIYWAVVSQVPAGSQSKKHKTEQKKEALQNLPEAGPEGWIPLMHYIQHNGRINKSFASEKQQADAKRGILEYREIGESKNYRFLEINLVTGRHHQIRAQLSAVGLVIKGDLKYGARRSNPDGGIHLHARRLIFTHPETGKPFTIEGDPPQDVLWDLFPRR